MLSRLSANPAAACQSTASPGQPRWPRPNTVVFQVAGLEKGSRSAAQETLKDVLKVFPAAQVMGLQPRGSNSYHLTFTSQAAVLKALETGILVNGHLAEVTQVSGGFTVITITDFPLEVPDAVLKRELSYYGDVKKIESCRYPPELGGLLNGDRKVFLSMKKRVPNIINIAGFECVAWYRDVDRLCRRCGKGGHMAADCEQPLVRVQRCGICGNRWHATSACKGCLDCQTEMHGPESCPRKSQPPRDTIFDAPETPVTPTTEQEENAAGQAQVNAAAEPQPDAAGNPPLIPAGQIPLIGPKPLPTVTATLKPKIAINKPPVLAIGKLPVNAAGASAPSLDTQAEDLANAILFGHLKGHLKAAQAPTYARKSQRNKKNSRKSKNANEPKRCRFGNIITEYASESEEDVPEISIPDYENMDPIMLESWKRNQEFYGMETSDEPTD